MKDSGPLGRAEPLFRARRSAMVRPASREVLAYYMQGVRWREKNCGINQDLDKDAQRRLDPG